MRTLISTVKRSILPLVLVTAAATAFSPAGSAQAAVAGGMDVQPTAITGFSLIQGLPQWEPANRDRLQRTVFRVMDDGTFAMIQPDGYPTLVGTATRQGDNVTIQGSAASSVGSTAATTVEVHGTINVPAATMELNYVAQSTIAAVVGAGVPGGGQFGASNPKAYQATVTLQPV